VQIQMFRNQNQTVKNEQIWYLAERNQMEDWQLLIKICRELIKWDLHRAKWITIIIMTFADLPPTEQLQHSKLWRNNLNNLLETKTSYLKMTEKLITAVQIIQLIEVTFKKKMIETSRWINLNLQMSQWFVQTELQFHKVEISN